MRASAYVSRLIICTIFSYGIPVQLRNLKDHIYKHNFVLLTDLDNASKHPNKSSVWLSYKLPGTLSLLGIPKDPEVVIYLHGKEQVELESGYAYSGRGMELSDLSTFYGAMLSVDDRSGIVFRIDGGNVIPWVVLADGDGNRTNGFKGEWMTVKDGNLYIGSHGNPWMNNDGKPADLDRMWIKKIHKDGSVEALNWTDNYFAIQKALGVEYPNGYVIHEACQWSDVHKKWFFMPRGVSRKRHDFHAEGWKGANYVVVANEDFSEIFVQELGVANATRGFSAFAFVPGTDDEYIVALKTSEHENEECGSYISVYALNGSSVLVNDEKLPYAHKYEAIAFV